MKRLILLITLSLLVGCGAKEEEPKTIHKVLPGAEVLINKHLDVLKDKNVAIVTNHTAVLKNGVHLIDTLYSLGINISALFGPEHGIRGKASAGEKVRDGFDNKTGAPVFSLYGKNRKPTKVMLKNTDVILFDIQDVGARFYTYISTMYNVMSAAAEFGIPVIVLDRPNPINGSFVDGPVLELQNKSFVGIAPIPIAHGMTIGELAKYFKGERLLETDKEIDLTVIKCEGWQREYFFDETDLPWVNPSPNINSIEAALIYPGMCLIEATNVSEGRGTNKPFLNIGAPFIDNHELIKSLELSEIEGVEFLPVEFTPVSIEGVANNPKYEGEKCYGIEFKLTDRNKFNPVRLAINLIYEMKRLFPENFRINEKWMTKLYGSDNFFVMLEEGKTPIEIINSYQEQLNKFRQIRKKYLLYN